MRGAWHDVRTPSAQQDFPDEERHMIGATKAIKTLVVAATIVSSLALPAYSQGLNKRPGSGGDAGPPVENQPKVDEKGYKTAPRRPTRSSIRGPSPARLSRRRPRRNRIRVKFSLSAARPLEPASPASAMRLLSKKRSAASKSPPALGICASPT